MDIVPKPVSRTKIRKLFGREYFILKRMVADWISDTKFALMLSNDKLPFIIFDHSSPLVRKLKSVDMYLQINKIKNLELAVSKINGIIIKPGETFSFWRLVGRPYAYKGYKKGLVLENGELNSGVGGGLCQLGNLIYWMSLHSPLTITERWRHGYDVFPDVNREIPFACGATLSYNYIDLRLTNNSTQTFQFVFSFDKERLYGKLLSDNTPNKRFEIIETDSHFEQQWWGGYTRHNKIWRKSIDENTLHEKLELIATNNAIVKYNPLIKE